MHIPDGYLSPSTCAVMYAASAPCWWAALRRTRRKLFGRTLPLLSLFAAFSFVTMMFNLPLPGGTTGHAVGVGIAAIVLGPWASLLAISLALAIQALFFGDGGITTLGANCFNMAIAGSFAAWGIYQLVSLGAAADSRRRVVAAALAGYGAINLSALLAAIEFGIQPMLFHDASGAPLYAPYPLHIAIPAMMAGHLTIAGAAEAVMSAGLFSYLRRNEPSLVGCTARPVGVESTAGAGGYAASGAAPAAARARANPLGSAGGGAADDSAGDSGERCGVGRVGGEGFFEQCNASPDGGRKRTGCAAHGGAIRAGAMGESVDRPAAGLCAAFCKERGLWISAVGDVRGGADSDGDVAGATGDAMGEPIRSEMCGSGDGYGPTDGPPAADAEPIRKPGGRPVCEPAGKPAE